MREWTRKAKIFSMAVLAVLVVIVVLQNTESLETQILFATLKMPRAAMLLATLMVGFALGMLAPSPLSRRRK